MKDKNTIEADPREDHWPNTVRTRDELDDALDVGLASGVSTRSLDDIFESGIAKSKNG